MVNIVYANSGARQVELFLNHVLLVKLWPMPRLQWIWRTGRS